MDKISDVFAFATTNADYWQDLLSNADYPADLTPDEKTALEAAREHIDKTVVSLLHGCGKQLGKRLGLEEQSFKAKSTAGNQHVTVYAVAGAGEHLYGVLFALAPSEDEASIHLYASLNCKKGSMDTISERLTQLGIAHKEDGYELFAPGVSILAGSSVVELATKAVELAEALLKGLPPPPTSAPAAPTQGSPPPGQSGSG